MRLLIVEDERDLAEALRIGLNRDGYAVDVADTVGAAREKLMVNQYDVALLDITLPDGDGLDLARDCATACTPARRGRICAW